MHYTDEAVRAAVTLSNRYVQDRFLPDKAIDVLDEAGARTRVHRMVLPPEIAQVDADLARTHDEKSSAADAQEFETAARLRDEEKALLAKREELEAAWRKGLEENVVEVGENDIADVVSSITGVPVSNLTEAEASKLLRCEEVLHQLVVGQDSRTRAGRAARSYSSAPRAWARPSSPSRSPSSSSAAKRRSSPSTCPSSWRSTPSRSSSAPLRDTSATTRAAS